MGYFSGAIFVKSFIELVWIIQEKFVTLQCQIKTTNNYGKRNQKF